MEKEIANLAKEIDSLHIEKRVLESKKEEILKDLKENGIETEDIEEIKTLHEKMMNDIKDIEKELKELLEETQAKLNDLKEKLK